MRWRVFCANNLWNGTDKGPCLWRPMQSVPRQSCFDGIDENSKIHMKTKNQCKGSYLDEFSIEHNRTENFEVLPDEELEKLWTAPTNSLLSLLSWISKALLHLFSKPIPCI